MLKLLMVKYLRPLSIWFLLALTATGHSTATEASSASRSVQDGKTIEALTSDIAEDYSTTRPFADYIRREVMIPMRDGVRLYTVLIMKKGVQDAPILMSRTPYNAGRWSQRNISQTGTEVVPVADQIFLEDDYIRVFQDVRGRNNSEGTYILNRPLRGPLNTTDVDHATDAYDTIEWLVNNVPETNGRVALNGSSYPGFTTLMATIDPHPALKAVISMSPMVDGWKGDDWFHNGAFRQTTFDFMAMQTASKGDGGPVPIGKRDQYADFLKTGSAGDFADKWGLERLPFIAKVMRHVTYDDFWQLQAVDTILAERDLTVPTMLVIAQWDQEDSYGAPALYEVLEPKDTDNDKLYYMIGPWRHSGVLHDGSKLGPLTYLGDTAAYAREKVMKPFLDGHLKTGQEPADIPPVITYATGADEWRARETWPAGKLKPFYLQADFTLSPQPISSQGRDTYISDPAKPVPFRPRPVHIGDANYWRTWLLYDQRFAETRPDVLTYMSPPLKEALEIAGQPLVDLFAATSGSDSDWVVKVIDVYPEERTHEQHMAGYQLPIGMEIFRGRYIDSFEEPRPLEPGVVENYRFELPDVNHVFRPGHRVMVQIQSTWFPLYDRNPQTFVDNIFRAQPEDYKKATQTIHRGGDAASAVWLPVVE